MKSSRGGKRKRDGGSLGDRRQSPSGSVASADGFAVSSHPETSREAAQSAPPKDLNVIAFAEKRSREIRTLVDSLALKKTNKRVFQQLPRHMRRRAMSYNVKRLPKRLRAVAFKETSNTKAPKRPRRKYRKRGRNKKAMYTRRSATNGWLETHVWHAKRFHMIPKWGRKIAHYPNDKGFRAAFRASSEHCLMTDMSYLVCLELEGPQAALLSGLQTLTSPEIGRTFAYNDYLAGHLEGSCLLYETGQYPNKVLGPVRFSWFPTGETNTHTSQWKLHIWAHPSCSAGLVDELLRIFEMKAVTSGGAAASAQTNETAGEQSSMTLEDEDVDMKELPSATAVGKEKAAELVVQSLEYASGTVTLRNKKDDLVRFRLTGPKSTEVLKSVLKPANLVSPTGHGNMEYWWVRVFGAGEESALELANKQRDVWNNMAVNPSFLEVRAGSVLGLVVRDPRLFRPKMKTSLEGQKDTKTAEESSVSSKLPDRSSSIAASFIWDQDVRQQMNKQKLSDFEMNKLRSELPAPGSELDLGEREARVPILLVRNGGYDFDQNLSRREYGAGWDLIAPAGWAMSFWVPLVYSGARVGGLRELQTVSLHQASLLFPFDYPDSAAGLTECAEGRKVEEAKFQRYPPDKRPNYIKMGSQSPCHCPWKVLTREWVTLNETSTKESPANSALESGGFHVVRNLKLLFQLQSLLNGPVTLEKFRVDCAELLQLHREGLLPVCVSFDAGGTSQDFSTICIPNEDDLTKLVADKTFKGPVEAAKKDPFRKMAVKERRKLQVEKILADPTAVVDASDRRTFGYVLKGGYSFIRGKEMSVGYCSLLGLLRVLSGRDTVAGQKSSLRVLVRPPHSLQYQFADMYLLPHKALL
ncbi:hypothetical protein RvY_10438 [Ramazzottius varieornatus]|uniref:Uncharacterized protein n=1 Tax=Ramazzottius varieornatus TaxID=947166 RepID=A0A1D1VKJ1_RAMVA|nr:hypothetical protein RvY_10438 [Ramazzottius varieornatus]